jgi:hypothetical protein
MKGEAEWQQADRRALPLPITRQICSFELILLLCTRGYRATRNYCSTRRYRAASTHILSPSVLSSIQPF